MDEKVKKQISYRTTEAIDEHIFPGCVVGTVQKDGQKYIYPLADLPIKKIRLRYGGIRSLMWLPLPKPYGFTGCLVACDF